MERRDFVRGSALGAAAVARVLGANDRVRLALIGCGGRGRYVTGFMKEAGGCQMVAACDVYLPQAEAVRKSWGPECEVYQDFRRALDRKDIDAVVVATPDHWHAAACVLACRAGKHVYVEKPLTHNIAEGQAMVRAARETGRLVQAGLQHRSAPHLAECAEIVRRGSIGEVRYVRVWNTINFTPRGIGRAPNGTPPEGLDWDMFCGPAPLVPFNPKRFISTFRWFFDYSGGYITDFGTHRFDSVHQIMGVDAPQEVQAMGGRFSVNDAGEIPDVLQVTYRYSSFVLSYEGIMMNGLGIPATPGLRRFYNARGPYDRPNGMAFFGTNGTIYADRIGYELYPEIDDGGEWRPRTDLPNPRPLRGAYKVVQGADATRVHAQSFLANLRDGRIPEGHDVRTGHRSTIVPHLGNISYKTGLRLKWDGVKEEFAGAPEEARALLSRPARKPWNLI
jgi:predicted dehydrogenase